MHPHEATIFLAILTAAVILLILVAYFIINIAAYQRTKRIVANRQTCTNMHILEKEQSRIALDLHDGIGNELSAMRLQLEAFNTENDSRLALIAAQAGKLIDRIRQISFNLLPETLDKEGIGAALQRLMLSLPIRVSLSCEGVSFEKAKELQVFRIVQELVGNTLKHASATEINIALKQDGRLVTLRFRDNGKGFDRHRAVRGAGLQNIQARAALLNAAVFLVTKPGEGVSWRLEIPI